jgi:hypothetical protein
MSPAASKTLIFYTAVNDAKMQLRQPVQVSLKLELVGPNI